MNLVIRLDNSPDVAAVPESVMLLSPVRRFIIDKQHIRFPAKHFRVHHGVPVLLADMPVYQLRLLLKRELRLHVQPDMGEIKVVFFSFVPENAQKPSVQRHKIDLRPPAALEIEQLSASLHIDSHAQRSKCNDYTNKARNR